LHPPEHMSGHYAKINELLLPNVVPINYPLSVKLIVHVGELRPPVSMAVHPLTVYLYLSKYVIPYLL